jgi:hypothetical protein
MAFLSSLATTIRCLEFRMPHRENRIVSPDDVARWVETATFLVEESKPIEKKTKVGCLIRNLPLFAFCLYGLDNSRPV